MGFKVEKNIPTHEMELVPNFQVPTACKMNCMYINDILDKAKSVK
jgi:hypothetical protein